MSKKAPVTALDKDKKRKSRKTKSMVFGLFFLTMALGSFFPAASMIMTIGMMPTIVILLLSSEENRIRAAIIGALNFAGCFPFLLDIARGGHLVSHAFELISDPLTIVIIYSAAAIGYAIEWAVSGIASNILYERASIRYRALVKKQQEMVELWGESVTGKLMLDAEGFPLTKADTSKIEEND